MSAEIKAGAYACKNQGSHIVWQRLLILEQTPVLYSSAREVFALKYNSDINVPKYIS